MLASREKNLGEEIWTSYKNLRQVKGRWKFPLVLEPLRLADYKHALDLHTIHPDQVLIEGT